MPEIWRAPHRRQAHSRKADEPASTRRVLTSRDPAPAVEHVVPCFRAFVPGWMEFAAMRGAGVDAGIGRWKMTVALALMPFGNSDLIGKICLVLIHKLSIYARDAKSIFWPTAQETFSATDTIDAASGDDRRPKANRLQGGVARAAWRLCSLGRQATRPSSKSSVDARVGRSHFSFHERCRNLGAAFL